VESFKQGSAELRQVSRFHLKLGNQIVCLGTDHIWNFHLVEYHVHLLVVATDVDKPLSLWEFGMLACISI
jgi:hypothetical protein